MKPSARGDMLSMTRRVQLKQTRTAGIGRRLAFGLATMLGMALALVCLLPLKTLPVSAAQVSDVQPSAFSLHPSPASLAVLVRVGDGSQMTFTVAPGGQVTVPVQVAGSVNLAAATIRLSYRADVVRPVACARGAAFDSGFCNTAFDPGQVKFNVIAAEGVTGTHTLYNVVFQAVGGAAGALTTPLTLTVDYLADLAGNAILADTTGGEIDVIGQPETIVYVGDATHTKFTVVPGSSTPVSITFNITGARRLGAATLLFSYNPALVRPTLCVPSAALDGGYCNLDFNPTAGLIKLTLLSAAGMIGSFPAYTVWFDAAPGAVPEVPGKLVLTVENLADPDGGPLSWQTTAGGTITVAANSANSTWLRVGGPGETGVYTVTLGMTVTASVWVSSTTNLGVASWAFNYDPAVVRVMGCLVGSDSPRSAQRSRRNTQTTPEIDGGVCVLETGRVRANLISAQGLTGTLRLLEVILTAAPGATAGLTSPLTLTVENLADATGLLMPARVRAGAFAIAPGGVGVALARIGDNTNHGIFQVPRDDRVVAPIRVEGVTNLGAASLALAYDPMVVQPIACAPVYTGFDGLYCSIEADAVRLSAVSSTGFTGTATWFDLTFRPASGVVVGDSSPLTLTASNWASPDNDPLLLEAHGGRIVITTPLGAPQVRLGAPNGLYRIAIGQVVTVPLMAAIDALKVPLGLGAATLIVAYDPKVIQLRACILNTASAANGFDGGFCNLNYAAGRIKFNALSANGIRGNTTLVELAFVGQAFGSIPLTLTVEHLEDVNANALTFDTAPSSVVMVSGPTVYLPLIVRGTKVKVYLPLIARQTGLKVYLPIIRR